MDSRILYKVMLLVSVLLCAQALTATTVNIHLVPGPNNNSPSYNAYVANMLSGVPTGAPQGNPATSPAAWVPVPAINATYLLDTFSDFNSWEGLAGPAGAFAGEWGTDLYAAVDINGNGNQISLSGLTFTVNLGLLGSQTVNFTAGDSYRSDIVGYIGGVPTVTSGAATQLVDEIRYVGVAFFFSIGCPSCTPADQQSTLNDATSQIVAAGTQGSFTYSNLSPAPGATSFNAVSVTEQFVPEPATLTLAFLGLGVVLFRKFSSAS